MSRLRRYDVTATFAVPDMPIKVCVVPAAPEQVAVLCLNCVRIFDAAGVQLHHFAADILRSPADIAVRQSSAELLVADETAGVVGFRMRDGTWQMHSQMHMLGAHSVAPCPDTDCVFVLTRSGAIQCFV
jgi:hypothetical protein